MVSKKDYIIDLAIMIEVSEFISNTTQNDNWETIITQNDTHVCYKCHKDNRLYFKKSLKPQFLTNIRHHAAFFKEFYMGRIIDCPYIVKYNKIVDNENECSLFIDFIEGKNLRELLETDPHYFDNHRVLDRFVRQLLEALQYMHHRQIIHMDLNPSNIMISSKSHDVKVIDLGFCYSDSYQDTLGTTKAYSASELHDGNLDFDVRTDIYAFGCILRDIDTHTSLPHRYKTIMKKCLAEKKEDRYTTVDDIIIILQKSTNKKVIAAIVAAAVFIGIFFITDCPRHIHRICYGYDFTDIDGIAYNITSTDSMTCSVMGYHIEESKQRPEDFGHIIIPEQTKYHGRYYTITAISDSAFFCDSTVTMISFMPKKLIVFS